MFYHWAVWNSLFLEGTLKSGLLDKNAAHIRGHPGGGGEVVEVVGRWWRWWGGGGGGGEMGGEVVGKRQGWRSQGEGKGMQGHRWELNLGPLDAKPQV